MHVLAGIALGVLAPREPLEPNTDYSIVIQDGEEYPIRRVRFRTGAGPTTAVPEPPVFRASEPRTGSRELGLWRSRLLEFEALPASQFFLGDHTLPDGPPAWGKPDDLSSFEDLVSDGDDDPDQAVGDGRSVGWISTRARFSVGITDCGFWPNGGDRQDLRFAAVDVAAKVSAWTEIGTIEIQSIEEAQLAYDARREAAARHNIQGPRACAMPPSLGRARSRAGRVGHRGALAGDTPLPGGANDGCTSRHNEEPFGAVLVARADSHRGRDHAVPLLQRGQRAVV